MLGNGRHAAVLPGHVIAPPGQGKHVGLVQAAQGGKGAGGIAVQGGVAHVGLGLVAGVHQHPAVLVGKGHEHHHAAPSLRVFRRQAAQLAVQRLLEGLVGTADGNRAGFHAQALRQLQRISDGVVAGIGAGEQHAVDVVRPEGVHAHGGRQAGVNAAGKAHQHVVEARSASVFLQSANADSVLFACVHMRSFPRVLG